MTVHDLAPLPVAVPLTAAALLLGLSKAMPRRAPDVIGIAVAAFCAGACLLLALGSADAPIVYWFGDWHLVGTQVVGISFVIDPAGAGMAGLIAVLFGATFVFSWGFFEEVHGHFHVLMLVFLTGMIGFCLTGDLFNMFVWFELMSVAGFAATAFELRPSAIAGALNFTIVNTVGSYLFLAGIALLYADFGALDMHTLGRAVAARGGDPVLAASFTLIAIALLTKGAQVPFQMWLGDAHAVAPSPVSVIFSGAMVGIALFGLAKLFWVVFAGAPEVPHVVQTLLLGLGLVSAVLGGLMAMAQRHIKRLLAFSTISHAGIMLSGFSLLNRNGTAALLEYLAGHGAVKGAMFMIAGFIAARCGGIDEVELRGRGREVWPMGVAMAVGGVLLAGLPLGPMDTAVHLIEAGAEQAGRGWVMVPILMAAAFTGAAVLRVAGRVFAGWGEQAGDEKHSESEHEEEDHHARHPLLIALPAVALLCAGLYGWDETGRLATWAASRIMQVELAPPPHFGAATGPWIAVTAALLIAGFDLFRRHLPGALTAAVDTIRVPPTRLLQPMHSGLVTDYIAWQAIGIGLFALAFAFA